MSINITKKDVAWGYASIIMTLGSNLFLLPFILNQLPDNELGLWYTFLAVGNIANLFDFGFKSTMARNITYAWSGAKRLKSYGAITIKKGCQANFELLHAVMEASKKIYFVISSAAGGFLVVIGSTYIFKVSEGLDFKGVAAAWVLYVIAVFLNLYFGYLAAFLSGVGAIAESNKANVIGRSVQFVAALLLLVSGMGIASVSIAYLLYGIVFRQCARFYFYKYEGIGEQLKKCRKKVGYAEIANIVKTVWHNAWRDGLVSFASYLNGQASTLLCSWFLSLEDTAIYGLSMQLVNAIAAIACAYFSTYQAKMQSTFIAGEVEKTKEVLSTALVVYYILYFLGSVSLCTVGIPILAVIKSNTKLDTAFLAVLLVYMLFYKNQLLCASYIAGTNRIPYMKAYLVSGVAIALLTAALLAYSGLGMWSLVVVPMAVELAYDYWRWPMFVLKELHMGVLDVVRYGCLGIKHIFDGREIED